MLLKKLVLPAFLLASSCSFGQTAKLVLEKGKKYELVSVTKLSTTASVMGQEMESVANNESTDLIEVKDVRANEIDISSTLKILNTEMSAMGQEMNYNSANKNNTGPLADQLGKRIDKTKNYTVDLFGKTIREDATEAVEEDSNPMMGLVKETGLTIFVRTALGREIKPDIIWTDTVSSTSGKLKTATTGKYLVRSIDNGIATINYTGVQNLTGTMEQMGQELNLTGTNKITSEIIMDLATGLIRTYTSAIDSNNTIEASGMSIPVTGKSTVAYTLKAL